LRRWFHDKSRVSSDLFGGSTLKTSSTSVAHTLSPRVDTCSLQRARPLSDRNLTHKFANELSVAMVRWKRMHTRHQGMKPVNSIRSLVCSLVVADG
jgi:hypothetical protein